MKRKIMIEFKKTLVWSIINEKEHPAEKQLKISDVMPVIDELFPGINYYSVSGFNQVTSNYLRPALTKLFPQLNGVGANSIREDEMVTVKEAFLPSEGYEHLDNPEWKKKLDALL
jgi:hypothetical protein